MNPEPTWQHQIHANGNRKTVVLSGEIDMQGAARLQNLLHAAVRAADVVQVDTAEVSFIDSSVISALVVARNTAARAGRRLAVVNPSPQVHRVLDVTGVLDSLTADSSRP
ncbi:anti-anti-sigma factor [Micromonospora citrea]|uniref:Anti-sigma factor antagonist n=1 Tax=Micromonospora citrea TaxID=47855 RepID=A0A1C6TT04_9ACTN|nr:STAS domain-containing protein [Micromonospora citrea]SCL44751.1 anti-anti-sigma factor [Micromonospora citrea]